MKNFHDLFVHELQDLYDAENQVTRALPQLIENASSPELKKGFEEHLKQTKIQIERLEVIRDELDIELEGKKCAGMKGIIEEGQELLREDIAPDAKDAGLIAAAQKVEHYEIAGYGTAATYAKMMKHDTALKLLHETLEEEKKTDEKLTGLAKAKVNKEAMEL
jgi:ferritin-like metal-binding protein YciE